MFGLVTTGRAFNHLTTTSLAMTTQTAHRQRVELESRGFVDEPIHFEVVLLDGARESGPDRVVAMLVEREPRRLELDDGLVAFAER